MVKSRWLRWWGGAVLAALCASTAYVAQIRAGANLPDWVAWTLTLTGAVATVVALLLPARQTWAEVQAREDAENLAETAVATYRLALNSVLLPLTDLFDRIMTAPDEKGRIEAQGAAKHAVVNCAVQFINIPYTRSCFFEYKSHNTGRKKKTLVCDNIYAGRDSRPRTTFSSTDPNHAEIFKFLEAREPTFEQDLDKKGPLCFPASRDYKTYIAVPVATSTEIFGLLTIDALHADQLQPKHQKEMRLLAQLLGIALAGGNSRTVVETSTKSARKVSSETTEVSSETTQQPEH